MPTLLCAEASDGAGALGVPWVMPCPPSGKQLPPEPQLIGDWALAETAAAAKTAAEKMAVFIFPFIQTRISHESRGVK